MVTGTQAEKLHRALVETFSRGELEALLKSGLGLRLDRLTGPDAPLSAQVFDVIQLADRAGWVPDLIRAAFLARPSNLQLAALSESVGAIAKVSVQEGTRDDMAPPPTRGLEGLRELPIGDMADWLRRLAAVQNVVCRVEVGGRTAGTGFLVGPDAVLTSYEVLRRVLDKEYPLEAVWCRFDFRQQPTGEIVSGTVVRLHGDEGITDADEGALGYCLLRLNAKFGQLPMPAGSTPRGWLRVPDDDPVFSPAAPLAIAFYPPDEGLKLAVETRAVVGTAPDGRVRYRIQSAPGAAGAPCLDLQLRLVAMHLSRTTGAAGSPDGLGEGVSVAAIRDRLRRLKLAGALGGEVPGEALRLIPDLPRDPIPPAPAAVIHPEDPQRDRWGGMRDRNGRRLSVQLLDTYGRVFLFNAVVESTDGSPLEGPVSFHLHESYPKSVIWIRKIRDERRAVLEEVTSYGVYTIGAQVKDAQGQWLGLELSLSELPDLPQRFKER